MYDLVRAETKDGLLLRGLYVPGDKNKPAVIHIHGFQGDFFTQEFPKKIAEKLHENNLAFIAVQNRGTGVESEIYTTTTKGWAAGGASFELLEEAYMDIDAWIKFLIDEGYKDIILQGHSLGTMKVVRYLFEGKRVDKVSKLILLAPFDIMQLFEDATKGKGKEYLGIAEQKVKDGRGKEIIPEHFLDAKMSYQTYVSHHKQDDFEYMFAVHNTSYGFPLLNKINIPVKIIVGTSDPYFNPANPGNPKEALDLLLKNIKKSEGKLIEGAKHGYEGYEDIVAEEVLNFVNS
ncbi:MAG: alpha/beta hydrolase [Candidatus Levybacteria bacterium]|nr:alpha/beta hydrolase [Candidatus Levybacteria bacterium]